MKHIFKKLHHHPNRSNETPQPTPSSPSSSSSRTTFSTPSTTSATTAPTANFNTSDESNRHHQQQQQLQNQDYFSSEEEYQVQLALALSVSSSGQDTVLLDQDKGPIRTDGAQDNANTSADSMSRSYWDYGVLDFEDRVVDGFYDLYSLSHDSIAGGHMPSLRELERGASDYEVVLVNRNIDSALEELLQIARCIVLDCPATNKALLIQRLAEIVTNHMGGPVGDANLMLAKWMERSIELRTSLHTSVLLIGSLTTGLLRHRALLFKVLADTVGIPCRLLKGNHYPGIEDDAVNIIKLQDDCECLVDLMGAPGTLIPANVFSAQDTPFMLRNPKPSATFWNTEGLVSPIIATTNDAGGTFRPSDSMPSPNQLDLLQASGSSLYQGGRGSNIVGDGVRIKQNVVPYSQKRAEDPRNLFADLNPFQIKGSGTAGLNDLSNEVDKLQFPKNNNVCGRPPVPLMRRNHHEWNGVSRKSKYDFGEDNRRDNNGNVSSVGSKTSNVPSAVSKLPENSFNNHIEKDDKTPEVEPSKLSPSKEFRSNNEETYHSENQDDFQGVLNTIGNENGHNISARDRDEMNRKVRGTEGASSTRYLGATYVDAVIDGVGEREILWEDLVVGERIGLGSYGEVYHADWNGTEVAVKKFLDQDFSGAALDEFKREVRIMRRLRHQNVVLFMGAVTRPPNLSIVTEFLPLGSLYHIIHRPHCQIDEIRRIKMALDVAKGMNCLHTSTPTIVHRDLKSPNLLVDNNWNVKVCDFGLSRLKHNTFLSSKSTAGTPEWMAPEVLRNEPSNEKCDVYSFGVILWELATLRLPWSGMNPMQVVGAVGFQNRRLDIPKEVDPLVARIIWECWQMDPNLRPSFAQLIEALKPLQRLVVPSHVDQSAQSLP